MQRQVYDQDYAQDNIYDLEIGLHQEDLSNDWGLFVELNSPYHPQLKPSKFELKNSKIPKKIKRTQVSFYLPNIEPIREETKIDIDDEFYEENSEEYQEKTTVVARPSFYKNFINCFLAMILIH
jgi:hypothetical protein